jgi:hypothetical protein
MADESGIIATKLANALIPDAEQSQGARMLSFGTNLVMDRMKREMGGLWVGGRVTLTHDTLSFTPNALNVAAHAGDTARSVPLARVSEVTDRFGWFTRIVDVRTNDGEALTFRCFGAPAFAEKIRRAVQNART